MQTYITKEIQNNAIELIKSNQYTITEYAPKTKPCVYIGYIRVYGVGTDSYIYPEENIDKEYIKEWKQDVGMILFRCFKKNQLNKLFEISNKDIKFLIYKIDENELEDFKTNKFVHMQIGDSNYTIIKASHILRPFSWRDVDLYTSDNIELNGIIEDIEEPVIEDDDSINLF